MIFWIVLYLFITTLIFLAGTKLSKYGDIIAVKSGLGRTWIGVVLVASVTSLPELVTGISSVTYAQVPDIAVGDVVGSCAFNLLILSLLDSIHPSPVSAKAHHGHIITGAFGIVLLSMVVLSIFLKDLIKPLGWIGPYTPLILLIYFIGMRTIYHYEKRKMAHFIKELAEEYQYQKITLREALWKYSFNALIVVFSAMFLPKVGEKIAEESGLGQTLVGNIFIALSTSLPEVVVSFSAVKMGAIDLAIGNLLGSNLFNLFILAFDDLFFVKGPILAHVSENHLIPALSVIMMTAIVIIALTYKLEKKLLVLSWDSYILLLLYLFNFMLLYTTR